MDTFIADELGGITLPHHLESVLEELRVWLILNERLLVYVQHLHEPMPTLLTPLAYHQYVRKVEHNNRDVDLVLHEVVRILEPV